MYDWIHTGNRKVQQGMVSLVVDNFDKKYCSLIQRKWRQLYISMTERSTLSIINWWNNEQEGNVGSSFCEAARKENGHSGCNRFSKERHINE